MKDDLFRARARLCAIARPREGVSCEVPLIESASRLRRLLGSQPSPLLRALDELLAELPVERYRIGRLKAQLQRVVKYTQFGRPQLEPAFRTYLLHHERPYLQSLPGHHEQRALPNEWWKEDVVDCGPLLNGLFDLHAFKKFDVYELGQGSGAVGTF